ncbi:MAG: antibiotic biosynthesis monooxygenase [Bacteroidales bacterium]|nr:antibiotic biosynthesis monooxygenase [Bacteroidales bacterium]
MKAKQILCAIVALLGLAVLQCQAQQLIINIRYTGQDGNARKYAEEMESSGIAARIRAIEGCLGYDYFFPADDPEGLLLIDSWEDQEALNRYHASPAMQEAAALREKYGLGGRTVRMFTPIVPGRQQDPPKESSRS